MEQSGCYLRGGCPFLCGEASGWGRVGWVVLVWCMIVEHVVSMQDCVMKVGDGEDLDSGEIS